MTRMSRIVAAVLLALPLAAISASAQEKSLYHRLGGYDVIAAVSDDFGAALGADPRFARFFSGHSQSTLIRQRQLVVDLICQMTGGPCFYIGRDLKTTHTGLNITKADWDAAMKLFADTLNKHKIGEREQKDLAALMAPVEKDVVEKP